MLAAITAVLSDPTGSTADPVDHLELVTAAYRGDLGRVKTLLVQGADVNARGLSGQTALMASTWSGNVDVTKALIAAGANVNADPQGASALLLAAGTPYTDVVQVLIEAGADVNAGIGGSGGTPLFRAALNGRVEQVQMLLASHADPNARDSFGRTALMVGPPAYRGQAGAADALARHEKIARMLIEAHADVNARDNQGRTAIWYAGAKSHIADVLREAGAAD